MWESKLRETAEAKEAEAKRTTANWCMERLMDTVAIWSVEGSMGA